MRPGRWRGASLVIAVSALGGWPAIAQSRIPNGPSAPPNIVLIVADDLGAGWLGCEGRATAVTPNLDCLAENGVLFSRAYVAIPQCAPSRASLLTGRYPHRAGVTSNTSTALSLGVPTFPARLSAAGYRCGMIGKWHNEDAIEPHEGFFDGWVTLDRLCTLPSLKYLEPVLIVDGVGSRPQKYLTDALTDHALRFLGESTSDGRPFLLFLSYYAPHRPHTMHPDFKLKRSQAVLPASIRDDLRSKPTAQSSGAMHRWFRNKSASDLRYEIVRYESMISGIDANVGRILDFLDVSGLTENTVVIFTGDNGLMMGEHQMLRKGAVLYEELIRVPLIVSGPGVRSPGRQCDALVSFIDLCPTILRLAGCELFEDLDGREFGPLLRGESPTVHENVLLQYHETYATGLTEPIVGVVGPRYKLTHYVRTNEIELYDLLTDPLEMNNLAGEDALAPTRASLREVTDRFWEEIRAAGPPSTSDESSGDD